MTYPPRPYQADLLARITQSWQIENRRVMLQLPTGGGKTICFSHIVAQFIAAGKTALIIAHREELIEQSADKIATIVEIEPGIIKAGYKPDYSRSIQVASVPSLARRLTLGLDFDLIIIDEAHHATAQSYRSILAAFPHSHILGVTATPIRLDGTGFRDLFDDLVTGVSVRQLIEMGNLSPYKYYAPEKPMSLVGARKHAGDYSVKSIENANPSNSVVADCLKAYGDYLQGKSAVIFAVSIAHSIAISASFEAYGIPCAHLDGKSDPDTRSQTIAAFRSGKIRVLTNCALFDEGLDIPDLDGVILARPTASLGRYLQMVGRALRPSPNKDHAVMIDLAGNWERHGLPDDDRVWSLDGVKSVQRSPSKRLRRSSDGEIEEVTIELTPSAIQFQEIPQSLPPIADTWDRVLTLLIQQQIASNYQRGWVGFKLAEIKPPLEVWKLAGRRLGYHPKWAEHRWRECQGALG